MRTFHVPPPDLVKAVSGPARGSSAKKRHPSTKILLSCSQVQLECSVLTEYFSTTYFTLKVRKLLYIVWLIRSIRTLCYLQVLCLRVGLPILSKCPNLSHLGHQLNDSVFRSTQHALTRFNRKPSSLTCFDTFLDAKGQPIGFRINLATILYRKNSVRTKLLSIKLYLSTTDLLGLEPRLYAFPLWALSVGLTNQQIGPCWLIQLPANS